MTKSQFYRAIFAFLTVLCFLLLGILFVLITKDDWHVFRLQEQILTGLLIVIFLGYGVASYYVGLHKKRAR